jgi:mannose-6-phosphate isomerase-like protein (cupin superfamily)
MNEPQVIDVKQAAKENSDFRRVLFTGPHSQLVVMALGPGEDIGTEVHTNVDQLLYVVKGEGVAVLGNARRTFDKGAVVCVPAGTTHNVINTSQEPLKLFTVYSPPQHAPATVHRTKSDADKAEQIEVAEAKA